jgi:hypothetical protein
LKSILIFEEERMAERKMQAAKNGMFSISSRGPKVELHLGKNDSAKFHVIEKDMPEGLPTEWNKMKINWFTCFGVRHRKEDGGDGEYADVEYFAHMDEVPGKTYVAYYDGAIQELSAEKADKGKVRLRLTRGDPPIGMVPP